jgi:S1-C subfamily serine protease
MTFVLPVAVNSRPVGSAVLLEKHGEHILFATSLHLFGAGSKLQILLPPHAGNCRAVQTYPLAKVGTIDATIVSADHLADLAVLAGKSESGQAPPARIAPSAGSLTPGDEVVVLGYPFAPLGSLLETWTPTYVTAIARRMVSTTVGIDELVLSMHSHVGSSGSAVVGAKDGVLHGIVRGALAPPEVIKIGDVPVGTDTSVMLAPSAHLLHDMLRLAKRKLDRGHI